VQIHLFCDHDIAVHQKLLVERARWHWSAHNPQPFLDVSQSLDIDFFIDPTLASDQVVISDAGGGVLLKADNWEGF